MFIDIWGNTAAPDSIDDKSTEIQSAIQDCVCAGGGMVRIKGGTVYSGPLELYSNVTLHVDEGAVLGFIPDFSLYRPVWSRWEGVECWTMHPLLFAKDAENIQISGHGRLDGNGQVWWDALRSARASGRTQPESSIEKQFASLNPAYREQDSGGGGRELQFLRPPLVQFLECRGIQIRDLTLQNSPFWNTHLVYSSDITIQGTHFCNPNNAPNTDGLNLDSCANVRIEQCEFDVGDDCLGLKSGSGEDGLRIARPTEQVFIHNCRMNGGHGGIVIGSETAGGIRNIEIKNCSFIGTDRGLRIKTRRGRGGVIENIRMDTCYMEKVLCPLVINSFYRCGTAASDSEPFLPGVQPLSRTTPRIRDIQVNKLEAAGCRAAAAFLSGLPEQPLEALVIKNSVFRLAQEDRLSPDEAAMTRGLQPAGGSGIRLLYTLNPIFEDVTVQFPASEKNTAPFLDDQE